jgi:hypothetical protein
MTPLAKPTARLLVGMMRTHMPYRPGLAQMLADLERSKPADADPELRQVFKALKDAALELLDEPLSPMKGM